MVKKNKKVKQLKKQLKRQQEAQDKQQEVSTIDAVTTEPFHL